MPIVEGVAVMTAVGEQGQKTDLNTRIEKAMAQAVQDAYTAGDGLDPDKVRARVLAARDAELAK